MLQDSKDNGKWAINLHQEINFLEYNLDSEKHSKYKKEEVMQNLKALKEEMK